MATAPAHRVLLIGWDAADWKIINPLLDAGLMPALEGMINDGVIGNVATLEPPLSPMLWTSIATGKTADKHGILGFTEPDPGGNGVRPVRATSRKVKALWNILTQNGFRTHLCGWWPSHPAEPINGISVSNFFHRVTGPPDKPWPVPDGAVHPVHFAEALAECRVHPSEITGAHILPFVPRAAEVDQSKDKHLTSLAGILGECASVHAAATWALENMAWDFAGIYYHMIDQICHGFMKFYPPRLDAVPEPLFEIYKDTVFAAYRFHDMMLETLLGLAGDDATVILVSDHGFHSDHRREIKRRADPVGPAFDHRNFGVFCIKGPGIKKDERLYGAGLLDVAPTVLTLFGLPVGRDMDGKTLVEAFARDPEVDFIDSWDEVPGEAGMHPEDVRSDPAAEREALKQLVALGYIEAPDEDKEKAAERSICESQFYLARVHMSRGRSEEAVAILEALCTAEPQTLRYALRLAECYHTLNRFHDCRRLIDRLLAENERPAPGLLILNGTLLLSEAKKEEGIENLEKAVQMAPAAPITLRRLGDAFLDTRKPERAEQAFIAALSVDAENPPVLHGLCKSLLRQQRYEEAADAALRAIGLTYFFPAAHYHLGMALMRLGLHERAAEAFEICVAQAPGMRKTHRWLSELYRLYLDQPARAAEHMRFAAERIRRRGKEGAPQMESDGSSPSRHRQNGAPTLKA